MSDPLLAVEDLHVRFGAVRAVDGVEFSVDPGETVCLVGESGSGKTVTCEAVTRLLDAGTIEGDISFDGEALLEASAARLRDIRGNRIGYVFQNPGNALDPVYSVGEQLIENVREHRDISPEAGHERAVSLLDQVDIPNPSTRIDDYPHQFSGGMKQRVVIAMALAGDPDLLVLDEPTTALDATTEAGVLSLLEELQAERDLAVLFVTHDLGVVARIADRVVVMYAGKVMERAPVMDLFERPSHPYTNALLDCIPGLGTLRPVGGTLPDPTDPPAGCRFHPRCEHAVEECRTGDHPIEYEVGAPESDAVGTPRGVSRSSSVADADHRAACIYHKQGRDPERVSGTGVSRSREDRSVDQNSAEAGSGGEGE
ncbi:MAG: ABC transporter ATP-binding protein [Halolamina sp.]